MSAADLDWYARRDLGGGVTLIWERRLKPFYRCNVWHVRGRDGDLLIDSGMGLVPLAPVVAAISEKPVLAVASHGHVSTPSNPASSRSGLTSTASRSS